jgi:hypothetical protein
MNDIEEISRGNAMAESRECEDEHTSHGHAPNEQGARKDSRKIDWEKIPDMRLLSALTDPVSYTAAFEKLADHR